MSVFNKDSVAVSEIMRSRINECKDIVSLKLDNRDQPYEIIFTNRLHADNFFNSLVEKGLTFSVKTNYPITSNSNVQVTLKYRVKGLDFTAEYTWIKRHNPIKLPYLELEMKYLQLLDEHEALKKQLEHCNRMHIVEDGECLSVIIQKYLGYYTDSKLLELLRHNPHIFNASLIHAGERISIPKDWELVVQTPTAGKYTTGELIAQSYSSHDLLIEKIAPFFDARNASKWCISNIEDDLEKNIKYPCVLEIVFTETCIFIYSDQNKLLYTKSFK